MPDTALPRGGAARPSAPRRRLCRRRGRGRPSRDLSALGAGHGRGPHRKGAVAAPLQVVVDRMAGSCAARRCRWRPVAELTALRIVDQAGTGDRGRAGNLCAGARRPPPAASGTRADPAEHSRGWHGRDRFRAGYGATWEEVPREHRPGGGSSSRPTSTTTASITTPLRWRFPATVTTLIEPYRTIRLLRREVRCEAPGSQSKVHARDAGNPARRPGRLRGGMGRPWDLRSGANCAA